MEYLWGGLIALIILQIVILKVLIELNREIAFGLKELDENMAGAIASAAIAQLISMKAQEIPKQLTQRDETGKFKVNEILNP